MVNFFGVELSFNATSTLFDQVHELLTLTCKNELPGKTVRAL
jgi:hypothetical protein